VDDFNALTGIVDDLKVQICPTGPPPAPGKRSHFSCSCIPFLQSAEWETMWWFTSVKILSLHSTPLTGRAVKPQHHGHIGGPIAQPWGGGYVNPEGGQYVCMYAWCVGREVGECFVLYLVWRPISTPDLILFRQVVRLHPVGRPPLLQACTRP